MPKMLIQGAAIEREDESIFSGWQTSLFDLYVLAVPSHLISRRQSFLICQVASWLSTCQDQYALPGIWIKV